LSTVIEPLSGHEMALALASANAAGKAVIPRGGGTKAEWGNPAARQDVVLSTARMNRVVEHAWADMTATVEAGCTVGSFQAKLAEHGQRLACDPLWPERATIGGILATNDSGPLRLRFGALRDLIIGITIVLPDGTVAMSGGKVVKNVAGYDLPKLMTGALGTLGVITQAVFRLHPLPRVSRTLTISPPSIAEAQRILLAIQDTQMVHSALQVRLESGTLPELDILLEGTEAGIAAQEQTLRQIADAHPGDPAMWPAREQLWPPPVGHAIAKITLLPSRIAQAVADIERAAVGSWCAVMQATGVGWMRMEGDWRGLRVAVEVNEGSLVMLTPAPIDSWGVVGGSLAVMRALKHQFDPKNTLNPGRFAGGI